ncbi:unnamed protein product [Amoebophrya sp. A25]|nr:unnamed protein product [Amoebophrya sp. A25]|eukprot:GSA25T00015427001.1
MCGNDKVKSSWIPKPFRKHFCRDAWMECSTLETPWNYFGYPSMQQWNSACGTGPMIVSPFLSDVPVTQLGSCSGVSDICLAPQHNGSGVETHYVKSAARTVGMSQSQMEAWTNLQEFTCKDIGVKSLNREVLEMVEKNPETQITPAKLKFLWRDKVVFF